MIVILMQVVGPPQTLVPVAISRSLPTTASRPLLLDPTLVGALQIPSWVPIVSGGASTSGEFALPLAYMPTATTTTSASLAMLAAAMAAAKPSAAAKSCGSSLAAPSATVTITSATALSPDAIGGGKR